MVSCGTFQKLRPLSLLAHLSSCYDSAQLKVSSNLVSWAIYLEQGKIIYASHSVAPFDRLDCHLRRLSPKIPALTSEIRAQLRLLFETDPESQSLVNPDYQAISWLVERNYLNLAQTTELIQGLIEEVIESFLLVEAGNYELETNFNISSEFCRLDFQPLVETCQKRLETWKSLAPQIWSPYQRPYFANSRTRQQILLDHRLSSVLKGFSLRHLAVLLNQDEIQLAQGLRQYIVNGTILLQDPYPPFDQLPKTFERVSVTQAPKVGVFYKPPAPISPIITDRSVTFSDQKIFSTTESSKLTSRSPENITFNPHQEQPRQNTPIKFTPENSHNPSNQIGNPPASHPAIVNKHLYKIVCVDDSPTMLKELNYFLDDESFSVSTISDSVKALMQIIRIKPDLILLDVKMSGIDGYELCRLLRNHSLFKNTPIIMVTGNTGIIDRVKARLVGASGYLTKPFTQSDLLKLIFRHLS